MLVCQEINVHIMTLLWPLLLILKLSWDFSTILPLGPISEIASLICRELSFDVHEFARSPLSPMNPFGLNLDFRTWIPLGNTMSFIRIIHANYLVCITLHTYIFTFTLFAFASISCILAFEVATWVLHWDLDCLHLCLVRVASQGIGQKYLETT